MNPDKVKRPEDLDKLDKDGLIIFLRKNVRQDKVDLWNRWRQERGFALVDLKQANLLGAQLQFANLTEVLLTSANLAQAQMRGASLMMAQMQQANLNWVHLENANLHGAGLQGADLGGAQLQGADLGGAWLQGVDLARAHLRDVAISSVASLRGVKLYQTYFWGVLSLRYEQFLDERGQSTIWEEAEGRFEEAKDVYKTLKGYFEDAGDYEGANWAYQREQEMEKLMYAPPGVRWLYPRWRGKWSPEDYTPFRKPSLWKWMGLAFSNQVAGYGMVWQRPLIWLGVLVLLCAAVYWLGGMVTAQPGCGFDQLSAAWRAGCVPTRSLIDNLMFSLGALTSTDTGNLQPYLSGVRLLMTLEVLAGIALTGLFGFVLGNRLRYS